jgi:hypothetical protein
VRAGGVAEVVECLPRMHEAFSSNPSAAKRKENKILPKGKVLYQVTMNVFSWIFISK